MSLHLYERLLQTSAKKGNKHLGESRESSSLYPGSIRFRYTLSTTRAIGWPGPPFRRKQATPCGVGRILAASIHVSWQHETHASRHQLAENKSWGHQIHTCTLLRGASDHGIRLVRVITRLIDSSRGVHFISNSRIPWPSLKLKADEWFVVMNQVKFSLCIVSLPPIYMGCEA